ncbi:uncharacterized protein BO80DRAFT_447145 [Aspergillus ibericus CBS 121593]|uniref:MFS general substrate transporter n=1 Tax=Aspergillus ibericus CBS 121593 TaxID=1448316 RepID=A0A395GXJ6_9EURO|nr:hypothetical protein BO80DRAFT_447145 [Aspergillus ibericus CBS 121593]RAK98783.1 hypothetical protein BO80DRAFT_447145 [Aspergillus ibericus CBS 121593]
MENPDGTKEVDVSDVEVSSPPPVDSAGQYIQGARLYTIIILLCLALFLTNLEIPIVSTALLDLGGLRILFAPGAVTWRRYHGLVDLALGLSPQVMSPRRPWVGGGILLALALPNRFPHHNKQRLEGETVGLWASLAQTIRWVDILGSSMLLVATILLVAALEEANEQYAWRSAFTIVLLTISGVAWILFLLWERYTTLSSKAIEPVFPWRFVCNRVWLGMLLNSICLGAVWFGTMFQLPQRFQTVNQLSPLQAAIHFIPYTVAAPLGSVLAPTVGYNLQLQILAGFASLLMWQKKPVVV